MVKKILEKIKSDLKKSFDVNKRTRVYCIRRVKEGSDINIKGSYIFGTRKGNPWEGYGAQLTKDDVGVTKFREICKDFVRTQAFAFYPCRHW